MSLRHFSLAIVLAVLWWTLSGHTGGLILGLGATSVALVVWIAVRMHVVDSEGAPFDVVHRAFPYSLWLLGEIVKANIAMLAVVTARHPAIQPQIVKVPAGDGSSLGHVTYANSITMTPGTVTLEVLDDQITVHALTDATAAGLRTGVMERRAMAVGGPAPLPGESGVDSRTDSRMDSRMDSRKDGGDRS